MAGDGTDVTITFGDDHNDEPTSVDQFDDLDSGIDTSFDPSVFDKPTPTPVPAEPTAPEFNTSVPKKDIDKIQSVDDIEQVINDKIKAIQKANQALANNERKRLTKEMRRTNADTRRRQSREIRADRRDSANRRKEIRQESITNRMQAYSVSAALGMPGYVFASAYDQLVLKPTEKARLEQENAFDVNYDSWSQSIEDANIQRQRDQEDYVEGIVPGQPDVAAMRRRARKNLESGKDYNPRTKGFESTFKGQNPFDTTIDPNINPKTGAKWGVDPKTGKPYTLDFYNSAAYRPEDHQPNLPSSSMGGGGQGGGNSGDGGGSPPTGNPGGPGSQGPGGQGGGRKPQAPNINNVVSPIGAMFPNVAALATGPVGAIATAMALAVPLLQSGVNAVDRAGKGTQDLIHRSFGKDPLPYAQSIAKTTQGILDPLGVNIPAQIAVSGFETLLALTGELRDYAKKDLAFSPEALTASIEGGIEKLLKDIDLAQRTDPTRAEFIRVWTQIEILFNEFKAELFENVAPTVIALLRAFLVYLKGLQIAFSAASAAIEQIPGGTIITILKYIGQMLGLIADNTTKDTAITNDISQQILDFMNPNLQIQNMRQAFPNFVW